MYINHHSTTVYLCSILVFYLVEVLGKPFPSLQGYRGHSPNLPLIYLCIYPCYLCKLAGRAYSQ